MLRAISFKIINRRRSIQSENERPENGHVQDAPEQEECTLLNHIQEEEYKQEVQEAVTCPGLAELLQLQAGPDVSISVDDSCCSECTDSNSKPKQNNGCLVQLSVSQQFPKPPDDLNQKLQQHLLNIQNTVLNELTRLIPVLDERLMGHVINCYHQQTFNHLHSLLQNINSCQNHFVLMMWVLKTYLSRELLGHPELQKIDPIKNIDLLLWTELEANARDKLLKSVQEEVRQSLDNILRNETTHEHCRSEEEYVRVYVDTIQCINAVHEAAQQISLKLSDHVQEVCFRELLVFAKRYEAEQTEGLGRKATEQIHPETIHFLKTLKTCKELKQHVQSEAAGASYSREIVETLDNLEAFTLKLLLDIVANTAEAHLGKYFNSHRTRFSLLPELQSHFPKHCYGADEQKCVMDKAYMSIVQIYVKHLIKTNKSNLEKCWNPHVSHTVREDAQGLHSTMSELAPGVQQQNLLLLKVTELSDCECTEALKLTAATIQANFLTNSKDPELLPALLKWKGLSKSKVREVLQAIQQDHHPPIRPRPLLWKCW